MRPTSDTPALARPYTDNTAPLRPALWPLVDPDHDEHARARQMLREPTPVTAPLLHHLLTGLRAL